mmetsp:Transcript_18672/g.24646  ORF Transcript_18672/g.24646 Transcript_18672/m.24646 type:complete len:490 (+) Transcript_18672:1-1470(+)
MELVPEVISFLFLLSTSLCCMHLVYLHRDQDFFKHRCIKIIFLQVFGGLLQSSIILIPNGKNDCWSFPNFVFLKLLFSTTTFLPYILRFLKYVVCVDEHLRSRFPWFLREIFLWKIFTIVSLTSIIFYCILQLVDFWENQCECVDFKCSGVIVLMTTQYLGLLIVAFGTLIKVYPVQDHYKISNEARLVASMILVLPGLQILSLKGSNSTWRYIEFIEHAVFICISLVWPSVQFHYDQWQSQRRVIPSEIEECNEEMSPNDERLGQLSFLEPSGNNGSSQNLSYSNFASLSCSDSSKVQPWLRLPNLVLQTAQQALRTARTARGSIHNETGGTGVSALIYRMKTAKDPNLVELMLRNKDYSKAVIRYFKKYLCHENPLFLKAVLRFKQDVFTETFTMDDGAVEIRKMIQNYIKPGSPYQVNISSKVQMSLMKVFERRDALPLPWNLLSMSCFFDEAYHEIRMVILQSSTWESFLKSKYFEELFNMSPIS